jgi:hypothetical protein
MLNKKSLLGLSAIILVGALYYKTASPVQASMGNSGNGNFFSKFIDFISQKFNLDKTQVQNALNDYKTQERATITPRPTMSPDEIKSREKTRLDGLVSQGKITTVQENAILSEMDTIRNKYKQESFKDMTPEERKTQMDTIQNEIKTWAQSQGIDPTLVGPLFGGGRGFRGDGMMGDGGRRGMGKFGGGPKPTGSQ